MKASVNAMIVLMVCIVEWSVIIKAEPQSLTTLVHFFDKSSGRTRDTDTTLLTFCWNGRTFNEDCQKYKSLIQQILYKLLFKLKTQYGISDNTLHEVDDQLIPLKRRRNDASFFSQW